MDTCRVMRQDDNGNRFVVAKGLGRAEAERLAAEFEARGHKQLYWVEAEAA
ncbi:SPOR domain-containing protein [Kitasatospora sp. NPDC050463]|uniref:SPOR domain-containing protein n=1 Tax=Kitasatospora sp. NPDC050463 TaxID=3155786 RepID=UPI0033DDDC3E